MIYSAAALDVVEIVEKFSLFFIVTFALSSLCDARLSGLCSNFEYLSINFRIGNLDQIGDIICFFLKE